MVQLHYSPTSWVWQYSYTTVLQVGFGGTVHYNPSWSIMVQYTTVVAQQYNTLPDGPVIQYTTVVQQYGTIHYLVVQRYGTTVVQQYGTLQQYITVPAGSSQQSTIWDLQWYNTVYTVQEAQAATTGTWSGVGKGVNLSFLERVFILLCLPLIMWAGPYIKYIYLGGNLQTPLLPRRKDCG